jgi:pyruvate,water dikinase
VVYLDDEGEDGVDRPGLGVDRPSWTPLFLAAGGVITNIGAVGTHAVIVSRELGISCVPSIADATRRNPDGATITLDGSTGMVTIDALP